MGFPSPLANNLEDHLVGRSTYSPPSSMYLALLAGENELSGGGYQRQPITFEKPVQREDGRTMVRNAKPVAFPAPTSNWEQATDFKIFDAQSGGTELFSGRHTQAISVVNGGEPFVLGLNQLYLSFDVDRLSQGAKKKLMELVFSGGSYQPSTLYAVLMDKEPKLYDSGASISEISGGGYARVEVGVGSSNWSSISGHPFNSQKITFGPATEDWQQPVKAVGLLDAASGGLMIGSLVLPNQIDVLDGDYVEINADSLSIAF